MFIHSSPKFIEHLYDHHLELLLGGLLVSTSFSSSGILSYSFTWNIVFVTSFCLILCFFVYVLGRLAFFSNLEVTFCRRHPLQHCPSGHHALGVPSLWALLKGQLCVCVYVLSHSVVSNFLQPHRL